MVKKNVRVNEVDGREREFSTFPFSLHFSIYGKSVRLQTCVNSLLILNVIRLFE